MCIIRVLGGWLTKYKNKRELYIVHGKLCADAKSISTCEPMASQKIVDSLLRSHGKLRMQYNRLSTKPHD